MEITHNTLMNPNDGIPITTAHPVPVVTQPLPQSASPTKTEPARSSFREAIETLVVVTILVLMLKCFVAEAFVIPTGSMAETLLGYQKFVTCPDCQFVFPINSTEEMEPQHGGPPRPVVACTCPNCRNHIVWPQNDRGQVKSPSGNSGDRVLVSKSPFHQYQRWDVVVFKYPYAPQQNYIPQNYIKRLIGLPGETIAIHDGDLFVADAAIDYAEQAQPPNYREAWQKYYFNQPWPDHLKFPVSPGVDYTYANASAAQEAFRAGQFKILRKPPAQILSMKRIVYDNDHQSDSLAGVVPPRWQGEATWTVNDAKQPTVFRQNADAANDSWLRYRQYAVEHGPGRAEPQSPFTPEYITNVLGYNMAELRTPPPNHTDDNQHWVGDLILECNVDVTTAQGELILELSKGVDRFQARFDLASGICRLIRRGPVREEVVSQAPTPLKGTGSHSLRFANVDERLVIWVDGKLPFGDGIEYSTDRKTDKHEVNDKEPASIGVNGNGRVTVRNIKLFRDTYYTAGYRERAPGEADATMYVQSGHYLCMGDNSTASSDGRYWGLVPDRLMLGRAKLVYFPFWPLQNRAGPIR
jgi:signal peptidase I